MYEAADCPNVQQPLPELSMFTLGFSYENKKLQNGHKDTKDDGKSLANIWEKK